MNSLTLGSPSFSLFCSKGERAEFAAVLKRARTMASVPDTLLLLAIKSVIKNCYYFLKQKKSFFAGPSNPFKNLREFFLFITVTVANFYI